MADLNQQILQSTIDAMIRNGGKLGKTFADISSATEARTAAEKSDRILTEKIIATHKTYDQKLNTLNKTLSSADKQASILASSIRMTNSSLDDLVSSRETTAEYLAKQFPDKVAAGLNAFTSKTGIVIKDFKDVLQLRELGTATKNMMDSFSSGTAGQSKHVFEYLKTIEKSGTTFAQMSGMSAAATTELKKLTKSYEDGTITNQQKNKMSKLVDANMAGMVTQTAAVQKSMDSLAKAELKAANEIGDYWDGVAQQGKLGKIFAEHARPGGSGSIAGAFGDLAKSARLAAAGLLVSLGKKAITEMMDMAREGMQKGVEPFPAMAAKMYLSGKEYQEIMAANIQAVHASAGGYDEFNKIMVDHNNEFLKTAGMDPVLAAKNEANSMTMIRSFSQAGKTASDVSSEMSQLSKEGTVYRNVTGGTMEQFIALNQRLADDVDLQNSMMALNDKERIAMRQSITARVEEYQKMGLTADKAEELAKWLQQSSGMKSPADIAKEAAMVQLTASRLGMQADQAARLRDYKMKKEAGITLTKAELADQDELMKTMAKKYNDRRAQQNTSSIGGAFGIQQELISTLGQTGSDFQKAFGLVSEAERKAPGLENKGAADGPGKGAIMTAGETALSVNAGIDTLNKNVIGSWAFWGAGIIGAIMMSSKGARSIAADWGKKIIDTTAGIKAWYITKNVGVKAGELAVESKSLFSAAKLLKGGAAGIALMGAQHLVGDTSTAGKMLNSNTVNDAALGAGIGSFIPGVGTLVGGALGGAYGAYQDFTSPKNPNAPVTTPTEQAAEEKKRAAEEAKAKVAQTADSTTKSVDPQQLAVLQLQQIGQKLTEIVKLTTESNELYAMTEEEKKRARKGHIAIMPA